LSGHTTHGRLRPTAIAIALAAILALQASPLTTTSAQAQATDPEMSCAPETVRAGGTTTCTVAGATASTRVNIDVVRDGSVVGQSSAIAGTDGRATVVVTIPSGTASGPVTLTLRGSALTFNVTVIPGAPTGVSAGYSPSVGDVERILPSSILAVTLLLLILTLSRGRARPRTSRAD
jgi:hypothetical protein